MLTTRTQVKVLDFGLAKVLDAPSAAEEQTMSMFSTPGMLMGTVPYMSPEQVRGEVLDCRSDIFSFGTVLYEMLSGRRPFHAQSTAEIMSAILTAEPPPIRRSGFDYVGSGEERLIRKCLKKDAALRYQGMGDLISDLQLIRRESENGQVTQTAESMTVDVIRAEAASKGTRSKLRGSRLGLVLAAMVVVAVAALSAWSFRSRRFPSAPDLKSAQSAKSEAYEDYMRGDG